MTICSVHKIATVHKEGISKDGNAYSFDACPTPPVNGKFCKAEIIETPDTQPPLSETREPLEEPKQTNWDEVARGSLYIEAQKIAHAFYAKKDIDDEALIDGRAEHIYQEAWKKRKGT